MSGPVRRRAQQAALQQALAFDRCRRQDVHPHPRADGRPTPERNPTTMHTIATTLARIRTLFTALVLPALLLLGLSSCITNQQTGEREPDWPVISTELQLIEGDLLDLADVVAAAEPDTAENLRKLSGHVHTVKRGVDAYIAGGGPQGQEVFAAIDAALELADQLLDPDDETRIYVAAARMLARRIQAYLPQAPPST